MNKLEPSALWSIKVTLDQYEQITSEFDCFTREGDPDQVYIDLSCTDEDQDTKLCDILGLDDQDRYQVYSETLMICR